MRNYRLIFKAGVIIFATFMLTCTSQCIGMMIPGNSSGNSSFSIPSSVETSAPPIVSSDEEDSDFLPNLSNEYKESINIFMEQENLTEKIQPLFNDKLEVLLNDAEIEEINYESAKLNIKLSVPLEELNIKDQTYEGFKVKEIEISYNKETDALKIKGKDSKGKDQFENIIYGEKKTGVITEKKDENSFKKKRVNKITEVLKIYSNKEKNKQESKVEKIVLFHKDKEGKEKKLVFTSDKGKGNMIKAASVTDSSGEIQYSLASSDLEVNLRKINSTFGTSTDSLLTTTTDPLLQSTNISSESIGATSSNDLLSSSSLSDSDLSVTSGPDIKIQDKITIDVLEEIKEEMDKKAAENPGKKIVVGNIENVENNQKIQYAATTNPSQQDSITITLSDSLNYEIEKDGKKTVAKTSKLTLVEDKSGLSTFMVDLDTNNSISEVILSTSLESKKKRFSIEQLEEIKSRIARKIGMKNLLPSGEIKIPSRVENEIQNELENQVQVLNISGSEKLLIKLENNKDSGLLTVTVGNKVIKFDRQGKIINSL